MNKRSVLISTVISAAILSLILSSTQVTSLVYADRDDKVKAWESEDSEGVTTCPKHTDVGCKTFKDAFGENLNKEARDNCRAGSATDSKCKQVK